MEIKSKPENLVLGEHVTWGLSVSTISPFKSIVAKYDFYRTKIAWKRFLKL